MCVWRSFPLPRPQVLYDPAKFGEFTQVADIASCHKACGGTLNAFYSFQGSSFPSKKGKELIHVSAFMRNTRFRKGIPERPKWIAMDKEFAAVTTLSKVCTTCLTQHSVSRTQLCNIRMLTYSITCCSRRDRWGGPQSAQRGATRPQTTCLRQGTQLRSCVG